MLSPESTLSVDDAPSTRRGVIDLPDLELRCAVQANGCWLWEAGLSEGRPIATIGGRPICGQRITAIVLGRADERKPHQRWTAKCGNRLCLSPRCLVLRTHAQALQLAARSGRMERRPDQLARCIASRLRSGAIRPEWQVQWATESEQSSVEVAHALDVHPTTVRGWRNGAIRRLHDTDRSGWWMLIIFIPILGALILLFWMILEGTRGANQYGPDPKAADAAA